MEENHFFAKPYRPAVVRSENMFADRAGCHCSVDEGWAARQGVLVSLPRDLLYMQYWEVLDVVESFIASKICEEKKQQCIMQKCMTPCTACLSHPFLFQHAYVLGT